jgi:hypothetical protein
VRDFWTGEAMTYSVVRGGLQEREVSASRVGTFWIVLEGSGPPLPLEVALPCGREALALFSGEDEAEMFCSRGGGGPAPQRNLGGGDHLAALLSPDGGQARGARPPARDPGQQALGTHHAR